MWPSASSRGLVGLLLALLVSASFAGCFGDEEVTPPGDDKKTGVGPGPNPTGGITETPDPNKIRDKDQVNQTERVPEAHYHHYWGQPPAPEITVFNGKVTLDHTPCFDSDTEQRPPCFGPESHIGSARFNLETDGDQVDENTADTHNEGHADVIFTGTSAIVATFSWTDQTLGDELLFYYKPANSPMFLPREDQPPVIVSKEDPVVQIPVGAGMADPAHQYWVSRWEFMLVANGGPQPDWPFPVKYASGEVTIEMIGKNGGKQSIDPPHPDPWKGRDMIAYPGVTGNFEIASVRAQQGDQVNQRAEQGSGYEDIEMPVKSIVPVGTDKVIVKAWVNATDEAGKNLDWGLKYHGANTIVYTLLSEYEEADGARVYTIQITDAEADPAYEKQSYFRFGIYPVAGDQDETGYYKGTYSFSFEVHKQPDFTYYY